MPKWGDNIKSLRSVLSTWQTLCNSLLLLISTFAIIPSFWHDRHVSSLATTQRHSHIHDLVWNVSTMHILPTQVPSNLATWLRALFLQKFFTNSFLWTSSIFSYFFLLQPLSHLFNHSLLLLCAPGLLFWNSQSTYLLSAM